MVDFKSMDKKEKLEYIWDYYKIHIISAIIIICVIISFVRGQATRVDYVANVTLIGSSINQSKADELEKSLTDLVVSKSEKKKEVMVEFSPTNKSEMSYEFTQKFVVRVSAGEIGVLILDKSLYDNFMRQGMFLRLDNISDLDLSSLKYNKLETTTEEQGKGVYAISAEGNKILQDLGYDTTNKVIGIVSSSNQKENDMKIFKWFMGI